MLPPAYDRYLGGTLVVPPPLSAPGTDICRGLAGWDASLAPSGVHGSGTHGLHTLTTSPPPRLRAGYASVAWTGSSAAGGWTRYWRGMVMRWGEQLLQTTRPHLRQWCLRKKKEKGVLQTGQAVTSWSGCHRGSGSRLPEEGDCRKSEKVTRSSCGLWWSL